MGRHKDNVEQSEKKENKTFHIVLVTSLVALLLVSFIGFGYGLGAVKIVDIMQQHLIAYEKENGGEKTDKEGKLDINSRTVQYLYNEVTYNMDKSKDLWQYDDKNEDVVALNVVGMNLNDRKARLSENDAPAYEGYEAGLSQGELSKYFTKAEVESVLKIVYGKDAVLDTSKDINIYRGISVYHYDQATDRYYSYHKVGGFVSGPVSETGTLDKAVQDGSRVNIYQKVDYVDESDSSKNTKYYYVYHFEKDTDGMYKFINRTKEEIK